MHTLTNNYRDVHILNLGSSGQSGPYLVTQTGVSPTDVLPKEKMFVLRPDGQWVDFNAYASQGKPEAMDEIVFTTTTQIMAMATYDASTRVASLESAARLDPGSYRIRVRLAQAYIARGDCTRANCKTSRESGRQKPWR